MHKLYKLTVNSKTITLLFAFRCDKIVLSTGSNPVIARNKNVLLATIHLHVDVVKQFKKYSLLY